jgi:hypothetical protein
MFGLLVLAVCATAPLAASGARLEGDYQGNGNSFFEKLSFRSGGKVRVTFAGMTKVGTFELDGNEVLITIGNETNVFTIDAQGCVVGGGLLGKYCKGGSAAPSDGSKPTAGNERVAAATASAPAGLSGIYRMGDRDMSIALDFKPDRKVRVLVAGRKRKKSRLMPPTRSPAIA